MIHKHPLRPDRLRQIPPSFSWVDHRLVRHQLLRHAEPAAWALYLFLVTVADVHGLSYYSDASIARHLKLDALMLGAAREQLIRADLLAYRKPLYQVLALPEDAPSAISPSPAPRQGEARSVAEILRSALKGGSV
jgi:hypothetical protein